jgi:hypothetical protein
MERVQLSMRLGLTEIKMARKLLTLLPSETVL